MSDITYSMEKYATAGIYRDGQYFGSIHRKSTYTGEVLVAIIYPGTQDNGYQMHQIPCFYAAPEDAVKIVDALAALEPKPF